MYFSALGLHEQAHSYLFHQFTENGPPKSLSQEDMLFVMARVYEKWDEQVEHDKAAAAAASEGGDGVSTLNDNDEEEAKTSASYRVHAQSLYTEVYERKMAKQKASQLKRQKRDLAL